MIVIIDKETGEPLGEVDEDDLFTMSESEREKFIEETAHQIRQSNVLEGIYTELVDFVSEKLKEHPEVTAAEMRQLLGKLYPENYRFDLPAPRLTLIKGRKTE